MAIENITPDANIVEKFFSKPSNVSNDDEASKEGNRSKPEGEEPTEFTKTNIEGKEPTEKSEAPKDDEEDGGEDKGENKEGEESKEAEEGNENLDDLSDVEYQLQSDLKTLGIQLDDSELETFNEIANGSFDNPETHAKYVNKLSSVLGQRQVKQVWNSLPADVREYASYRSKGGTPDKFFKVLDNDYSSVEIKEKDKDTHTRLISERYQTINNMSKEEAYKMAQYIVANGEGFEEATKAKNELVQYQKNEQKRVQQEVDKNYQSRVQEAKQTKENYVRRIVQEGKVKIANKELTIPEAQREQLAIALVKPYVDKDGNYYDKRGNVIKNLNSIKDVNLDVATYADAYKLSYGADADILSTYLLMFGGLDGLIDNQVKTEKVNRLRKLRAPRDDMNNNSKQESSNKQSKPSNITFRDISGTPIVKV